MNQPILQHGFTTGQPLWLVVALAVALALSSQAASAKECARVTLQGTHEAETGIRRHRGPDAAGRRQSGGLRAAGRRAPATPVRLRAARSVDDRRITGTRRRSSPNIRAGRSPSCHPWPRP